MSIQPTCLCCAEGRPGASVYSYSSSSFGRVGGGDGTSYNRTFTERVGPGGVRGCGNPLYWACSLGPVPQLVR